MKILGLFLFIVLETTAYGYTTTEGLQAAWTDEKHAIDTYQAVVVKFGAVKPFYNILAAEKKHLSSVENIADRLAISLNKVNGFYPPEFSSVKMACEVGIQAELDNIALYDKMLLEETNGIVLNLYRNLRDASLNNHLPAFRRCAR